MLIAATTSSKNNNNANKHKNLNDTSFLPLALPASFLNLLHFFGDDDRVALPDLGGAGLLVVEVALVLITVPVY